MCVKAKVYIFMCILVPTPVSPSSHLSLEALLLWHQFIFYSLITFHVPEGWGHLHCRTVVLEFAQVNKKVRSAAMEIMYKASMCTNIRALKYRIKKIL